MNKDQILLLNKAVRVFRDIGSPYVGEVHCFSIANLLIAMEREIKALQKERDAAVEDLKYAGSMYGEFCNICKYQPTEECEKRKIVHMDCFEWRGAEADSHEA